jgi:hypothetical protein
MNATTYTASNLGTKLIAAVIALVASGTLIASNLVIAEYYVATASIDAPAHYAKASARPVMATKECANVAS